MPTAISSYSLARDWNSRLMEGFGDTSGGGVVSRNTPLARTKLVPAGTM